MAEHLLKNSLDREKVSHHITKTGVQHLIGNNFWYSVLPVHQSIIISSKFYSLEKNVFHKGLSLKYVISGQENYQFDGRNLEITNGQYILVNEHYPKGDVMIANGNNKSVCLDIDTLLIKEMIQGITQPDEIDSISEIGNFFISPDLFIQECHAGTILCKRLESLHYGMENDVFITSPQETIYDIVQLMIEENLSSIRSYYQIRTAKISTRKELYRRLLFGKSYLDDHIFMPIEIKKVAQECCMSEYRFYRLFKQAFNSSPYHYLLRRKIEKSLELKKLNLSWTEIATLLNFSDLAAFSHTFKKIKGVHPTIYKPI
ncbi:AraC family transcriptional regulator [Albibacterium sp.]|uniref:helix-turn-helix domain-containing protein n=1 Tax=Albibacterium sp. TaxID=2952885 RepID=UPI002C49D4F7|nr:AraC family transcriptional regulator [Albibacterium sp.]HUH18273.1 AraC family transcriptional regulator [Albibacterium sp.]